MKHLEYELQKSVCKYINLQYPEILYMSDTIANVKLNITQASRNKGIQKQAFKCPDLIIFKPNKGYNGLFIELKKETPFKRNGELKSNEHLQGQYETILHLRSLGYVADFAWSFDMAKYFIDEYLK